MSELILQPFRSFTYVTAHSPSLAALLLRHRYSTYITWRAAHAMTRKAKLSLLENVHSTLTIQFLVLNVPFQMKEALKHDLNSIYGDACRISSISALYNHIVWIRKE